VLVIAPQPFYLDRGTPINVKLFTHVLGEAGYEVDLLVFPCGQDVHIPNVHVIRLPNIFRVSSIPAGPSKAKLAFDLLLCLSAAALCIRNRYDVIHGVEEGGFLAVSLGTILRRASVFDMDSCMSKQLEYSGFIRSRRLLHLASRMEAWALGRSSIVLTMCSALSASAAHLAPHAKIFQVEDIPPPAGSGPDLVLIDHLRDTFRLWDLPVVLYTGNLESYQGIDLLLQAWSFVLRRLRGSQRPVLVLVGGPMERVEYYRQMAADGEMGDWVRLVGPRPLNEMSTWMEISDVLVSPRAEGDNTPLKIYSYMASGRPVVATRRATHTQVLSEETAFLADPEPIDLGQALVEAISNKDLAGKRAAQARELVERKYTFDVFKSKILEAYSWLYKKAVYSSGEQTS
jgi:glycosyltransferase involved in cell wall biosynthesis